MRRPSEYFRNRSSVVIVDETRGVPFQVVSLLLGCLYCACGVRSIFVCDVPLPFEGADMKQLLDELWPDCQTNKARGLVAGVCGIYAIISGVLRLQVGTTTHVADLYNAMALLELSNVLIFVCLIKTDSFWDIPMFFQAYTTLSLVYEGYVLYISRRAYISRLKMKKVKSSAVSD